MIMAKKISPKIERPSNIDDGNTDSKLEANKIKKELNPHHQNAKPKGKK
jgi:hypothetical protein